MSDDMKFHSEDVNFIWPRTEAKKVRAKNGWVSRDKATARAGQPEYAWPKGPDFKRKGDKALRPQYELVEVTAAKKLGSQRRKSLRPRLAKRDGPYCYICGYRYKVEHLTIDHMVPLGRGGTNAIENLALCCNDCNKYKSDMTEYEYREWIKT